MPIWAIADLHLSFGTPDKNMDVFGDHWLNHPDKIEANWRAKINDEDLVLLAGDISWAKHLQQAMPDLEWIDSLPGTKVMIRGNHDYWWSSIKKVRELLPPSIHAIQNDTFIWNEYEIGGARMWDSPEYSFNAYIPSIENPVSNPEAAEPPSFEDAEKIFERELHRLDLSLKQMGDPSKTRIIMTHYPPIGADLHPSRTSAVLHTFDISVCVFGHLHNVETKLPLFGEKEGIRYVLTAADYIDFDPVKIYS